MATTSVSPLASPSHSPHVPHEGLIPVAISIRPVSHQACGIRTFYVSGNEYVVQHIRRRGMNRWQCSCPNFFFRCVARRRHCKHIHAVRTSA
jgi:hypothetical protein